MKQEYMDKYYRIFANIDLDAIKQNAINLKKLTKDNTMSMAVIKTDGYGHGAVPIARALENIVDRFAVATANEALNLRSNKIIEPICILGYINQYYYEDLIENQIRPVMFSFDMIEKFSKAAVKLNKQGIIHIAIDTGMGRIGFKDDEKGLEEIIKASKLENIVIEGAFTHFSKADEKDKSYANFQLDRFNKAIKSLLKKGLSIPIVHCSNSAGIIDLPKANCDMVRLGISLYGLYPSNDVNKKNVLLTPVMSLYSRIVFIKDVEKGDLISYGGTFMADRKMKVATISAGYGDGYPRNLSNKGYVIIRGIKAKILGRVCMDQFMVDVSNIKEAAIDDVVTLVGKDGDEEITIDELSKLSGIINYEFVCNISKRVPRIYFENNKIINTKDYFEDLY